MKRFHVHLRVKSLEESINFYNALFGESATIVKPDYAKWMLENPKVNFAISTGHAKTSIEHLGLQVDSAEELQEVHANMEKAKGKIFGEGETTCCYSKSKKAWITDPQGVDWEAFYTHGTATVYGDGVNARPAPEVMKKWDENDNIDVELDNTNERCNECCST